MKDRMNAFFKILTEMNKGQTKSRDKDSLRKDGSDGRPKKK